MNRTDPTRVVRVSQTGQITVPKELRDKHGIAAHARFGRQRTRSSSKLFHIRTRSSAHERITFEIVK